MEQSTSDLIKEIIKLPRAEQLEVIKYVLHPDNQIIESVDVESAWEEEIANRITAIDDGTTTGVDYDEAMQEIEKQFQS